MIPERGANDHPAPFLYPVRRTAEPLVDYERGGVALYDATQGLDVRDWVARYEDGQIIVSAEGLADTPLLTVPGASHIGLAFNQNMAPHLCWTDGTDAYLWWFDPNTSQMETMTIAGSTDPCLCMDENRQVFVAQSDIQFSYTRGGNLYCRTQRERFQTERMIEAGAGSLTALGMNRMYRLQWRVRNT